MTTYLHLHHYIGHNAVYVGYEICLLRGCNVDQPKNLAKSVTVE